MATHPVGTVTGSVSALSPTLPVAQKSLGSSHQSPSFPLPMARVFQRIHFPEPTLSPP